MVADLPPRDQELLRHGLLLGRAISEYKDRFERGDFLVTNLAGADEGTGAIAVNGDMRVGQTVQFHVRDAASADEDLSLLLSALPASEPAAGALLCSCNGRGTRLFDAPDHDVRAANRAMPQTPVAGFFAAGELGPVGGHNFVHGHTASCALFRPGP
jgi:small ligand-binding sensory domain FIST